MRTSDREIASRRAHPVLTEWQAEWAAVRGEGISVPAALAASRRMPADHDLDEAAVVLGYELPLSVADAGRRTLAGKGSNMYRAHVNYVRAELEDQVRATATGDDALVRDLATEAMDALGVNLDRDSGEYRNLIDRLNAARLAGLKAQHRRNNGELEAVGESPLIERVRQRERNKAKPGETIAELFEVYAAELLQAKKKRPAGADQDRTVVAQFGEFVGRDTAVAAIGYEQAKEYVDALARVPAGYKKRKDFDGLSVHKAIEKGQRDKLKTLSPITQQRYISTLSPFFSWLQGDRGGRRVATNPFDGLHLDTGKLKQANARPPFTAHQITTIINSPLFTGFQAVGKEHLPGNQRADDWRYWLPLICLFSGARIGEVAQLHVEDIFRAEGVWCAEFRSDEQTGQQTKNDKSRIVALHSTLLKMGLLAFVERQRKRADKDGNRQLFLDLEPGPRNQYGDAPSKWWRRYLNKIGVKSRGSRDGFGSHSFRHTLADQLRAAGHLDDVFGPLIHGHYKGGVTGGYGQARQGTPKLSSSLIESVRFVPIEKGRVVEGGEPVDFSRLFVANSPKNANAS